MRLASTNNNMLKLTVMAGSPISRLPTRIVAMDRPLMALVLLLVVAVGYWLWFGLEFRHINVDDGISVLAAQSILERGYSQLPSGFFYNRGYISHYLLAASIQIFGLNSFSIMAPNLILALGSLLLVYRIAKDILGIPWLGVAAIALLLTLELQGWFATGPRMYMALQFFTLLAVYGTWRGYIQGQGKFKVLTTIAIIAAMFSLRQGVILAAVFPVTTVIVMRLNGSKWSSILSLQNMAGLFLVGLVALFVATYTPGTKMPVITAHDYVPDRVGLNLSPVYWGTHLIHFEETLPFGLALLPIAYVAAIRFRRQQSARQQALVYLLLMFSLSVLVFGTIARGGLSARAFFFVLPIYAILVCVGMAALVQFLIPKANMWFKVNPTIRAVVILLLVGGGLISVALGTLQEARNTFGNAWVYSEAANGDLEYVLSGFVVSSLFDGLKPFGLAKRGYGLPCDEARHCGQALKRDYQEIRQLIRPGELVITIAFYPFYTNYYLGHVDGVLGQRRIGRSAWTTYDSYQTDEYFGVPIIDSIDELQAIRDQEQRIWVIVTRGTTRLSPEMQMFLDDRFHLASDGRVIKTYVNCIEPPCAPYARANGVEDSAR